MPLARRHQSRTAGQGAWLTRTRHHPESPRATSRLCDGLLLFAPFPIGCLRAVPDVIAPVVLTERRLMSLAEVGWWLFCFLLGLATPAAALSLGVPHRTVLLPPSELGLMLVAPVRGWLFWCRLRVRKRLYGALNAVVAV